MTYWIDVCQNDGNLLVSCGTDTSIKIFDKRESKIIKTFDVHSRKNLDLFKKLTFTLLFSRIHLLCAMESERRISREYFG